MKCYWKGKIRSQKAGEPIGALLWLKKGTYQLGGGKEWRCC